MFHQRNNLFFGRTADGSMRVIKLKEYRGWFPKADEHVPEKEKDNVVFDQKIPPNEWKSVVEL